MLLLTFFSHFFNHSSNSAKSQNNRRSFLSLWLFSVLKHYFGRKNWINFFFFWGGEKRGQHVLDSRLIIYFLQSTVKMKNVIFGQYAFRWLFRAELLFEQVQPSNRVRKIRGGWKPSPSSSELAPHPLKSSLARSLVIFQTKRWRHEKMYYSIRMKISEKSFEKFNTFQ